MSRLLCLTLIACSSSGPTLRIDLRTDFVPEDELIRTEVTLDDETQVTETGANTDWLSGERIAVFEVSGSVEATVRLIGLNEVVLAERTLIADVRDDVGRTVVITRDCRGVECPEACVGGRCVSTECSPESPELCPEPQCTVDTDCQATAACAVATCLDGTCYQAAGPCGVDQFCDPDAGCRSKSGMPLSCENPIDVTGLTGVHRFNSCGFRDVGQGECSPEGSTDAYFRFDVPPDMSCEVRRDSRTTPVIHNLSRFDPCGPRSESCFGGFTFSVATGGSPAEGWFSVETENGCGEFELEFVCEPR